MNIKEIIQAIAQQGDEAIIYAKIVSVDETAKTCEVITVNDELTLFDIRLIANEGDGVLLVPTVDTLVGISMINETDGWVSLYSQLDSVKFGDGSNGGLINISDLVSKINEIEDLLTSLVTKFNSHDHITTATVGATAVPGIIAPTTGTETGSVTNITESDIENTTITHGNY